MQLTVVEKYDSLPLILYTGIY